MDYSLIMETARDMSVAILAFLLQSMGWMIQSCMTLTMWDLSWLLPLILVVLTTFRSRSLLFALLSSFWKSLEADVNAFCQRHFPPPPSFVLPPNTVPVSAEDVSALNLFADAIQRRIDLLRKTKVNFVRSRTGIVYRLNACRTLQKQLAQAQRALADERSSHRATQEFLQHQSNARADAEADIKQLKAQLAESRAADEIVSPPIASQPEDTDPQPQTVDESAQTIARVTKELEDLQADYNKLEDERDIWREAFEELEKKAEEVAADKEHHERRAGALETQLGIERTSREEAQAAVDGLRDENKKLREELQESKAQHESLQTAYQKGERANEEKAAELTSLQAKYDRLQTDITDLRQGATSTLDGSAPEFIPSASFTINRPTAPVETTRPSRSWADMVDDSSESFGLPDFDIDRSFVEDPFHGEDPFPEIVIPEPTPAPRAAGPGQARNAHVQKLNEEVKRREWREKSGMESSAGEEEGTAGPKDVLDDMYDRQVAQALTWAPTRYARGSMFGALNDVPSPVESVSTGSTPSRQSCGSGEKAVGSSNMPMLLGGYEVTRGDQSAGSASEALQEEEIAKADSDLAGIEGGEGAEAEKPEEDGPEEPKAEEEGSSVEARGSPCPPAATQDVMQQASPATRDRLPSNYWPEVEEQPKTHDERVGEAIADVMGELARERGLGSLRESRWAEKPGAEEEKKKEKPEEAPAQPTAPEAPSSPVLQRGPTSRPDAAGDQEPSPRQQEGPSNLFFPAEVTHADFISQHASHSTPLAGSIWATTPASPRSDARGSTADSQRGRGRGRDGMRGGPSIPSPATPGPTHGPPGSSHRGGGRGRGRGRGAPAAAARGGGGSSAASDSFRRLQERMAREAAERGGK